MQEKQEWIRSRKKLLKQIKGQVLAIQGRDEQIDAYANAYKLEFRSQWQAYNAQDLVRDLSQYQFVLGGDFHAFTQAQRTHLRILRDWPDKKSVVLALECIEAKYQKALELYLIDELSEQDFLEEVQWMEHWGFTWSNYKPLLEFAKNHKIPVFAINRYFKRRNYETLYKRDDYAAKQILKLGEKFPNFTIYTIFGDLHLAFDHLPKAIIKNAESDSVKIARVFQNSERLYFSLAKKNLESTVEVLRASQSRYCVMSSPPWVKWQSYLMFLEGAYDEGLHEDYDSIDFTDQVAHLISIIQQDLRIKVNSDQLAVYTSEDFDVWHRVASGLTAKERRMFLQLIASEKTFILPKQAFYYLSRASLNHCSHLAGFYIHQKMSGLEKKLWNMPKDFLPLIWHEAAAFFLSKIINHKRKSDSLLVIENNLRFADEKERGREAMALVLDQKTDEWIYVKSGRHKKNKLKVKKDISYVHAAKILGSIMGEKLYNSYSSGRMSRSLINKFLQKSLTANDFEAFYYLMVKRLEAQTVLNAKGARS